MSKGLSSQARPRSGRVGAVLAVLAVGVAASFALLTSRDPGTIHNGNVGTAGDIEAPILRALDPNQPLMPTGREVSLSEAEERFGHNIPLPNSQLLGDEMAEVWYSSTTNEVATRFGSKLFIEYPEWSKGQDPGDEYASQASSWAQGETAQIGAYPAWLIPADSGGENLPPVPVVHISIRGLDITLYGDMTLDELVEVAATLRSSDSAGAPGGSA